MRKRSKYRPRPVLVNPVAYAIESVRPVAAQEQFLIDLKIKNHGAMAALAQGRATRDNMVTLSDMLDISAALSELGFGNSYHDVLSNGGSALREVIARAESVGKYILRGPELASINLLMELHDAQMEVITVRELERAIALATKRKKRVAA